MWAGPHVIPTAPPQMVIMMLDGDQPRRGSALSRPVVCRFLSLCKKDFTTGVHVPLLNYICRDPFLTYGHIYGFQAFGCGSMFSGGHHVTRPPLCFQEATAKR